MSDNEREARDCILLIFEFRQFAIGEDSSGSVLILGGVVKLDLTKLNQMKRCVSVSSILN